MGTPAVFLDRDGVINVNRDSYVRCWDDVEYLPGTFDALRSLSDLGVPIVVVTNQAGVNRGMIPRETIEEIHRRMLDDVQASGARVDEILFCPHRSDERCGCRKPEPGLLLEAARRHDIDLTRSVMVGDSHTDVLAGKRAGCRTILVLTGRGRASIAQATQLGTTAIAESLSEAVTFLSAHLFASAQAEVRMPGAAYDVAAL